MDPSRFEGSPQPSAVSILDSLQQGNIEYDGICTHDDFVTQFPGVKECYDMEFDNMRVFWFLNTTDSGENSRQFPLPQMERFYDYKATQRRVPRNALKFLRMAGFRLNSVVWVPCICDHQGLANASSSSTTRLFFQSPLFYWDTEYELNHNSETYFAKNGKSWIWKAYSLNMPCFCEHTNNRSIPDYPIGVSSHLLPRGPCFAIPLKVIHPDLPPLILEVFPSCEFYGKIDPEDILRLILLRFARILSKYCPAFETKLNQGCSVCYSHSDDDNYVYFNVWRSCETVANCETSEDNVQPCENDPDDENDEFNILESIFMDILNTQNIGATSKGTKPAALLQEGTDNDNEVQCYEHLGCGIEQQPPSLDQERSLEAESDTLMRDSAGVDELIILNATEDCQLQLGAENLGDNQLQRQDHLGDEIELQSPPLDLQPFIGDMIRPNSQEAEHTSAGSVFLTGRSEISLEIIQQYKGRKLADAERELGVSRSTIKRRCRELGIKRWPWPKRNKEDNIHPNSGLGRSLPSGGEVIQESEVGDHDALDEELADGDSLTTSAHDKGIATEKDINQSHKMIVKATYRRDTVKFHMCSNLGFEKLLKELKERFKPGKKGFKLKYQDKEDGDWIMIACTKDLQFYMDNLVSAGENRMDLILV